jgi:hypothetical protein
MSSVTSLFVLVGNDRDVFPSDMAEGRIKRITKDITDYVYDRGRYAGELPEAIDVTDRIISLDREDWDTLQFGSKAAGGAAVWIGWNYADTNGLIEDLTSKGWKNVTIWWQHENDDAPSVKVI